MNKQNPTEDVIRFSETDTLQAGNIENVRLARRSRELDTRIAEYQFIRQESGILHNPFEWGYTLFTFIREGDTEGLTKYYGRERSWIPGMPVGDPLRYHKNIAIILISVVANFTAMEKLLEDELCYTVSDAAIQMLEEACGSQDIHDISFAALRKYTMLVQQEKKTEYHPLLKRTKAYIRQHFHEELTVAGIAKAMGVSPEYLTRVFRKTEGCTVKSYINAMRMRQIRELLQFSEMSIAEISRYLGYASQSYMSEVFRRETGFTPKQYRDRFKES